MIRVCLMRRKDRETQQPIRNWECQWEDPVTGRKRTKSTGTSLHREAERFRASLEVQLNESRGRIKSTSTWKEFEAALKSEYLDHRSEKHRKRVLVVLGMFVSAVDPQSAFVITDEEIAEFVGWLRKRRRGKAKKRVAETTIKSHLACLRLVFKFAKRRNFIREVPHFEMPKGVEKPKGRPITREELERMIGKLEPLVGKDNVKDWTFFLNGLWWSGLRLHEALKLDWVDDRQLCVDLSGKRPVLRIQAMTDKGRVKRTFPMAPGFARHLETVPKAKRDGRVFHVRGIRGEVLGQQEVGRLIGELGDKAKVIVADGKYASAQDLRRAFATRWVSRVRPAVLQRMMRHKSITTTMKFYADLDAQDVCAEMWSNDADGAMQSATNTSANIDPSPANKSPA
jgi:integrase